MNINLGIIEGSGEEATKHKVNTVLVLRMIEI